MGSSSTIWNQQSWLITGNFGFYATNKEMQMICPFCSNGDSLIIHTQKFKSLVRRVRFCQQCGMAWRTFEDSPVACRDCGNPDSSIINSEKYEETVRRTRKCPVCALAWKTYETVIDDYSVIDFEPHEVDEEVFKRRRRPEYATSTKAQLSLFT